jgi:hypothetical protein
VIPQEAQREPDAGHRRKTVETPIHFK